MDLINTFAAISSVLIALFALYKQQKNRELVWDVSIVQGSLWNDPPFTPFPNRQIVILTILNGGRSPILSDEFESSMILQPLIGGQVYGYLVVPGHEKFIDSIEIDESGIFSVKPKTLNKGDAFSIVLINSYIIQGHNCISLNGHIREIKKFESLRDRILRKYKINSIIGLCGAFTAFLIVSVSAWWYVAAIAVALLYWILSSVLRADTAETVWQNRWSSWFQDDERKKDFETSVKLSGGILEP